MTEVRFVLGDKLPWVSEMVLAIVSYAPGGSPKVNKETTIRKAAVNAYAACLVNLWNKAFGQEYVCREKAVKQKIRKHLEKFFNEVTCNRRTTSTRRERIMKWKMIESVNQLFDILQPNCKVNSFNSSEKQFYLSQKDKSREGYISEQIDIEYEKKKEDDRVAQEEKEALVEEELSYIYEDDDADMTETENVEMTFLSGDKDVLSNRSGLMRHNLETEDVVTRQEIQKQKNFTEEIKSVISNVSYATRISVDKARVAVKVVCAELYNHNYYLTADEQEANEPPTSDVCEPTEKRARLSNTPRSKEDYERYRYVLPSPRVIRQYKHVQATQEEMEAGMKLYNSLDVCVTFHYDTTSRCNIDGEWPARILNFADGPRFNLRPLFFAYEDRENISELIFETYSRLAAATSIALKQDINAKSLWEKTNNLMTDSVTKNLQIGELVAEKLQSLHVPYHLCKAHVVEKFDTKSRGPCIC